MEGILRESRPAVQSLLHPEMQWHGHGTLDLPFDHGSSRETAVSFRRWGIRCDISIRPAVASRGRVVTERPKSSHDPASAKEPIVFVIDDDVAVRTTLGSLFRSVGLRV